METYNDIMEICGVNFNGLDILDTKPIVVYSKTSGRRTITKVSDLPFSKFEILQQLKLLKKKLNCNGTFKNNELLFLGEHKNYLYEYYKKLGHEVIILP